MLLAGIFLREFKFLSLAAVTLYGEHCHPAVGSLKRLLDRVGESRAYILAKHKSVNDNIYIVLDVLIESDILGEVVHIAVNADSCISRLSRVGKDLLVHTLLRSYYRCEDHKASALGNRENSVYYLVE